MNKVTGTIELAEKLKKDFPEISKSRLKEVIEKLLIEIKHGLINDENFSFKGYFSLHRGRIKPKESKRCERHEKAVENYKRINKGKGIQAYASSSNWIKLLQETKECNNCKAKKQKVEKFVEPTNRVVFKPSSKLLEDSKSKPIKRKR